MKNKLWYDWKWQVQNSVTDIKQILNQKVTYNYNMRVTPYYMSLMKDDDNCPIRKQAIPSHKELEKNSINYEKYGIDITDSLCEKKYSPVSHLVHRYPDRVMIEVTNNCFMYCRFCTRKRLTKIDRKQNDLKSAYKYIRENENIRDVLLSGGNPLTLEDSQLEEIISTLKEIKHIEIIRIGTRAPVVMPMRITDELTDMLRKYHPIWINTHFNHPVEVTEQSQNACEKLINAGIPMGNQSVLLKEINDNVEVYKELCLKLVKMRVRPYYLYQCDIGEGLEHFRTNIKVGVNIIKELRQNITGFAIPAYVIDAPNGGGKITINPENIVEWTEDYVKLKNYLGDEYYYPEI